MEIKVAVNKPTYAQVVRAPIQTEAQQKQQLNEEQEKEKAKHEQAKKEVVLSSR